MTTSSSACDAGKDATWKDKKRPKETKEQHPIFWQGINLKQQILSNTIHQRESTASQKSNDNVKLQIKHWVLCLRH